MLEKSGKLLVIIVTTNDDHWLDECLGSLAQADCANARFLLIRNACTAEYAIPAEAQKLPIQIYRLKQRQGFAACNNLGLILAWAEGYDYVFLLNPDTKVHKDALRTAIEFMDAYPEYGILGCRQIEYNDQGWDAPNSWMADTLGEAAGLGNFPGKLGHFEVLTHYYVQGAALMLRVKEIPRIGILDTIYWTFYEETDLCRRCLLAGSKIALLLDSKVKHYGGGNWKSSRQARCERDRLFLRNQYFYFLSNPDLPNGVFRTLLELLRSQAEIVLYRRKDVILPFYQWPLVLLSVVWNLRFLLQLTVRNRIIKAGRPLQQKRWSIGPAKKSEVLNSTVGIIN